MATMTKEQKMRNLVNLLAAAAMYDLAVDSICDIVECEQCPYHVPYPDDEIPIDHFKGCQGKLGRLRDTIRDIEKAERKLEELKATVQALEEEVE